MKDSILKKMTWWQWVKYLFLGHIRSAWSLFKLTREEQEEIFFSKIKKPDKKEIIHTFCSVMISVILLVGIVLYFFMFK